MNVGSLMMSVGDKGCKVEVTDIPNKNILISLTNFFTNRIFYFDFKVDFQVMSFLTSRCKRNSEKFIKMTLWSFLKLSFKSFFLVFSGAILL